MHGRKKDWKKELKKDGTYSGPKPWNPHWKYLEAPIFYSKSGGARYPIEKLPRVKPGRFRVISTWPNKDFAGLFTTQSRRIWSCLKWFTGIQVCHQNQWRKSREEVRWKIAA
jgi:hypothetical protein